MFGLTRDTVAHLIVLLVSVALFNGIVYNQYLGPYVKQYPYVALGIGLLFVVAATRISKALFFLDLQTAKNFCYVLAGILMFNGMVGIPQVLGYFQMYSWVVILVSIGLLMFKDKISNAIGG